MNEISEYLEARFTNLSGNLQKYKLLEDPESLHEARIELKRIRAVFNLTDFCTKKFNKTHEFKELKEIFRQAGRIREKRLASGLLNKYGIKIPSRLALTGDEMKLSALFVKKIPGYKVLFDRILKRVKTNLSDIDKKCLKKYLRLKNLELKKLIYPSVIIPELHAARKIIKEIICLSGIPGIRIKFSKHGFDKIQDTIGNWNDKQMILKLLNSDFTGVRKQDIARIETECDDNIKKLNMQIFSLFHPVKTKIFSS